MKVPSPLIFIFASVALFASLSCNADDSADSTNDPFQAHSDQAHQVQVIGQGTADLEKKLEMISSAQNTLDLEYFVFRPDQAGRLVLQALLKRASDKTRPIQIRILVDSSYSKKDGITPEIAGVLATAGMQVKYFNEASKVDFSKFDHRDHRKLMIADATSTGGEFCGGGRNMADDYLDLGTVRTRNDRDVCVKGPLTSSVEKTFQTYWDSPLSRPAALASSTKVPSAEAQAVLKTSPQDIMLLEQVHEVGTQMLANDPTYSVHSISFISDRPELTKGGHIMEGSVENFLKGTQKKLTIENMLYLPTAKEKSTVNELSSQGKDVTILTDSPEAADNYRISTLALRPEKNAAKKGAEVYLQSGKSQDGQIFLSPRQDPDKTVWGTHTKTIVRDSRDTSIGSFNFDSRSANINFEDQIVIYNSPELATAVEKDIQSRTSTSRSLDQNGNSTDCDHPDSSPVSKTVNWTIESVMRVFDSQY